MLCLCAVIAWAIFAHTTTPAVCWRLVEDLFLFASTPMLCLCAVIVLVSMVWNQCYPNAAMVKRLLYSNLCTLWWINPWPDRWVKICLVCVHALFVCCDCLGHLCSHYHSCRLLKVSWRSVFICVHTHALFVCCDCVGLYRLKMLMYQ